MHDIKAIRDNPKAFDAGLAKRNLPPLAEKALELDEARRANLTALQDAQSRRNAASKEVGKAKGAKDEALAASLMAEVASLKDILTAGEEAEAKIAADLQALLEVVPNLPRDDVPEGKDEHDNKEVRKVGTPGKFDFKPKQHFELGEALGLMDFESATKVSGARFVFLKGALARMERAIGAFMLDTHTAALNGPMGGYTEVNPPLLVKDQAAYGTGNLPKFAEDLFEISGPFKDLMVKTEAVEDLAQMYLPLRKSSTQLTIEVGEVMRRSIDSSSSGKEAAKAWDAMQPLLDQMNLASDQLETKIERVRAKIREVAIRNASRQFLIPTAEVSLTNLVRDQILDEDKLPIRMTACTPCFRSEAGSAGRDTRGMIRQHQFTKVELVSVTTPEDSLAEHERMTGCAEEILKRLGLPFRTMLLCTGDMGFASQKTYDIEVWLPGQDTYREISSCSVCGDFQARRMNSRYKPKGAKDTRFVHTLNGSGLAVGRTLVAIMENYQQADGSIVIPEVLRPYMGGLTKIG
ncbi:MAG: serine--tRNA ligase [Hyphomicrobiaceae bacterium]